MAVITEIVKKSLLKYIIILEFIFFILAGTMVSLSIWFFAKNSLGKAIFCFVIALILAILAGETIKHKAKKENGLK